MTIYTDIFSGGSISSPIAYKKIDFSANAKIQLLWSTENLNKTNPNEAVNTYVGIMTDLTGINLNPTIYLPDITKQATGASFTLVNRTQQQLTVNVYDYDGQLVTYLDGSNVSYITFYIVDNTKQSGWKYLDSVEQGGGSSLTQASLVVNSPSANFVVNLYWANQTPPATNPNIQPDILTLFACGTATGAGTIKLPNPDFGTIGYSFKILNLLSATGFVNIQSYTGGGLTTISRPNVDGTAGYDCIFYIGQSQTGGAAWYFDYVPRINPFKLMPYNLINLAANASFNSVQLIWGDEVLPLSVARDYVASITNIVDSSPWTGKTVYLPDATKAPVGTSFTIVFNIPNTANKNYKFMDYNQSLVWELMPVDLPRAFTCYLKNNSTSGDGANTWGVNFSNVKW